MSFERDHSRYIVIKDKDLTLGQRFALNYTLKNQGIPTRESLVIESDWPIYEQAWESVKRLAEGRPQELDEIKSKMLDWHFILNDLDDRCATWEIEAQEIAEQMWKIANPQGEQNE